MTKNRLYHSKVAKEGPKEPQITLYAFKRRASLKDTPHLLRISSPLLHTVQHNCHEHLDHAQPTKSIPQYGLWPLELELKQVIF